uniref:DNA-directed DNA polymerase n=1 Tax=Globodera rostochiensis TaxID=31243 RepID=A0A914I3D3_GLORO
MVRFNPLVEVKELGRLPTPKGKFSLFYALELARNYQLINKGITEMKFRYLEKTDKKQRELVLELMGNLGIGGNAKTYGVGHLGVVQAFWDKEFPDMFRIVAFDLATGLKPLFKGEGVRKYEVCVISNNGHWDGMKSVTKFFKVKYYCVSCEVTYDRSERHRMECKERCKNCCRMGFGFPCKDEGVEIYCEECNRKFRNEGCFEAHKKKVCQLCKKCKKCGALYRTRDIHTCGEKFCKRCMVYHPERQCFIKKTKIRPNLPRYRIVAYDLETTVLNGEHQPNLVSAAVTCSVCAGEEKECEICGEGPKRMTWSMAEGVIDPMSSFVDWIMGDFWLLSQNPLAELPKTLELDIPAKLYFPHKYNKNANFGFRLPHLPPLTDYCPDNLREETCAKLEKWYNENYETEFELGEQLRIYCESDVAILMAAVLKAAHGMGVRDVLCPGRLGRMACVLRRIWEGRMEQVWECDVKKELKRNKEMKKFFEGVPDEGPINPRDAYSGGRTMPFCLYAAASDNVEISMFDIISLYPFVNYDSPYPVGIPKIVQSPNYIVNWTEPDHVPYDGLLKVKVVPPKNMLYPLLSIHADDMLLFANCGICAKTPKKSFVLAKNMKKCEHNDEERALLGTFTSIELKKALELGYKVIRFYRAYHFEEFDSQLFKGYVRMFLRIKVEASGWPPEAKTEEEKRAFIEMYKAKYNIVLDYDNIRYNPGLRLIAKLGLNSLWGKFSMRNTLTMTEIVSSMERYLKLDGDDTLEITMETMIMPGVVRVNYAKKLEFIKEHSVSNIFLSLWTTSAARIKLYEYMEQVYRAEGCKLLYCDTDSLVFTHPKGLCPLKEGKFLGEMTREYAESDILEFVAAGPKQYSLKLRRKSDGEIWEKTKIRGMSLDTSNRVRYEEFKNMVLDYAEGRKKRFYYKDRIRLTGDSKVLSTNETKDYEPVQRKGIIDSEFNVLPFGYY